MNRFLFLPALILGAFFIPVESSGQFQGCINVEDTVILEFKAGMQSSVGYYTSTANCNYTYDVDFPNWNQDSIIAYGELASTSSEIEFTPVNFETTDSIGLEKVTEIRVSAVGDDYFMYFITSQLKLINVNLDSTLVCGVTCDSLQVNGNDIYEDAVNSLTYNLQNFGLSDSDYSNNLGLLGIDFDDSESASMFSSNHNDGLKLVFTPEENLNGTINQAFTITAPDGETLPGQFTIEITPVADISWGNSNEAIFAEGGIDSTALNDFITVDDTVAVLNWAIAESSQLSDSLGPLISINPSTGQLTFYGTNSDYCGTESLDIVVWDVNDSTNSASTGTVSIQVNCVNDPPVVGTSPVITPIPAADGIFAPCEGSSLILGLEVLESWFLDTNDTNYPGDENVTPGINWGTIQAEGDWSTLISWSAVEQQIEIVIPDSTTDSGVTEFAIPIQVADYNSSVVTDTLNLPVRSANDLPQVTSTNLEFEVFDGDSFQVTIEWADVDGGAAGYSSDVVLNPHNWPAEIQIENLEDSYEATGSFTLNLTSSQLACGQFDLNFDLANSFEGIDPGFDVNACYSEGGMTSTLSVIISLMDEDSDGIPDHYPNEQGEDSDEDGIPDMVENNWGESSELSCNYSFVDTDGDEIPDWLDPDSDNDGIPDDVEGSDDLDDDDIPNFRDTDSDGDGILDTLEWSSAEGSINNSDDDENPDFLDVDSDNDLLDDNMEDENLNGLWDFPESNARLADSDGDGQNDNVEDQTLDLPWGTAYPRIDLDSDDDGLSDSFERTQGLDPYWPDTDFDFLWDGLELGKTGSDVSLPENAGVLRGTATDIGDGFDSFDSENYTCSGSSNIRYFSGQNHNATSPSDSDSDDDDIIDGYEDANRNGKFDGVNPPAPVIDDATPCANCYDDCPACGGAPYANAAESDPTDVCSPNCLAAADSCDCDGTADGDMTTQSNFCVDLWKELCSSLSPEMSFYEKNDALWSLLMPNDSCNRMVRDTYTSMPENAQSVFVKSNSISDENLGDDLFVPVDDDGDNVPYACDNCSPGFHLAYNYDSNEDVYVPCKQCSYSGSGGTASSNQGQADADGDGIGNLCDNCSGSNGVAGGVKGCMDYQAINYNPFAACEANSECVFTYSGTLPTVDVCASSEPINLLDLLGIGSIEWGGRGQVLSVSYNNDSEQTVFDQAVQAFDLENFLIQQSASCGEFEMTFKITHPIESEWFAFKDTAVTFHDYLLKDDYTQDYFNNRGIAGPGVMGSQTVGFYKELTFTLHVDPQPAENDSLTELCAGYPDDIDLSNPFYIAGGCGENSVDPVYDWTFPDTLQASDENTAQPTINLSGLNQNTFFPVEVTVGECTAQRDYHINVVASSSIDIQPTSGLSLDLDPETNSVTNLVQFCSNRTDAYEFTIATSGGTVEEPVPLPAGLSIINENTYRISFADISNSEASTFEFNLDPANNCPAQSTSITFIRRTAPTVQWNETATTICASSNDSIFGYTVVVNDSLQSEISVSQSNPIDNNNNSSPNLESGFYNLDFDMSYDDGSHIANVDLTLTIEAEDPYDDVYGFGCLAVSDTLSIQVAEAAAIEMTSGGSPFHFDTIQVCENTPAATYDFDVNVNGGEWDGIFAINEESVPGEYSSSISVDTLFAQNQLDSIVVQVKATTGLGCPSDSARIVFERRTAPSVSWLDEDSLILCQTAPNDIVIFSHLVGSTSGLYMDWSSTGSPNFISDSTVLSSDGLTDLQLNISNQSFDDNHVIRDTLVTTIEAEDTLAEDTLYGCAAVYDTLVVVVHEAPRIPTEDWNADFFGEPWCTPYSSVVTASLTHNAPSDLWNPQISVDADNLNGCQWFANDSLVAETITTGDTEVSVAMEWINNEENEPRRCASLYDTLRVKIGNSPVIDSLNFGLFPEATSTLGLFDALDYCAGGDPLSFLLWPEDLDDPQSSNDNATVEYNWTQDSSTDNLGGDSLLIWSPPSNSGNLTGQAQWTYILDGTEWTCSAVTTISLNGLLGEGPACRGLDIVELPYYSYAAQANNNGVDGEADVRWGYFSNIDSSAHYFDDPTVVNGVFYPGDAEWGEMSIDPDTVDVVSWLFAVVSFYEDGSCPCLSLGNSAIVSVDEQWIIDQLGFRVYPNPTTSGVYVDGPRGDFGPEVFAEFYDYTGKRVHRERMETPAREYFDLSHLRNGMYILRIVSPTDVLHTSTLVLTQY